MGIESLDTTFGEIVDNPQGAVQWYNFEDVRFDADSGSVIVIQVTADSYMIPGGTRAESLSGAETTKGNMVVTR